MLLVYPITNNCSSILWLILFTTIILYSTCAAASFSSITGEKVPYCMVVENKTLCTEHCGNIPADVSKSDKMTVCAYKTKMGILTPALCTDQHSPSNSFKCAHDFDIQQLKCDDLAFENSVVRMKSCCTSTIEDRIVDYITINSSGACENYILRLSEMDKEIKRNICVLEILLSHYDCAQKYSVHDCDNCRVAYKKWVYLMLLSKMSKQYNARPCDSICHDVVRSCPWFFPVDANTGMPSLYAGEPLFQCFDPTIPELPAHRHYCYSYCPDSCASLTPCLVRIPGKSCEESPEVEMLSVSGILDYKMHRRNEYLTGAEKGEDEEEQSESDDTVINPCSSSLNIISYFDTKFLKFFIGICYLCSMLGIRIFL